MIRLTKIILTLLIFSFIYLIPQSAFADSFTLSGHVQDSSGNSISGAMITVNDSSSDSTTTDSSGNYSILVAQGTYDIQATPPSGSSFTSVIALHQDISADTTLNFIFAPAGSAILSGHVLDSQGNGVPGQHVALADQSGQLVANVITDSTGSYSIQASTGSYAELEVIGSINHSNVNVPENYNLIVHDYLLNQDTSLDLTIPANQVSIHVQDAAGNPVSGAKITTSNNGQSGYTIGSGLTNAFGVNSYNNSGPSTDSSGNVTLWLLADTYTLSAIPPTGNNNYTSTNLPNVSVSGSTQETITLNQPVTLTGHVLDSQGNGVPGQHVALANQSGQLVANVITDSTGSYSIQASTGSYAELEVIGSINHSNVNVPENYNLIVHDYLLNQDTSLDLTIPANQVSIHVQDAAGNPVSGAKITTSNNGQSGYTIGSGLTNAFGVNSYNNSGPSTDSSGNVTLWLLADTYTLSAIPPTGNNNYTSTNLPNVSVSGSTQETITLNQPVTLTGHVLDSQGNGVPGQHVALANQSGQLVANVITDSTGSYSIQASTGSYAELEVIGSINHSNVNVPENYNLIVHDYLLNQDTSLDLTIPANQVSIHVQDAAGNPVSGAKITTSNNNGQNGYTIGSGLNNAFGISSYDNSGPSTDSSGNVTLWLLADTYTFNVTPQNGSIYSTSTLNNVTINSNQTELISLQYSHNPPTTTATLSPIPDNQGNYSDPTNVTLSATATSGYTVANTYYTIDGGSQQTYSVPFTVAGNGNHTIKYWSVDNSGVTEAHNTKNFTIQTTPQLTSLSPAKVWIGLKNSDDIGIKFDLKAEVYKGTTLISNGEIDSVSGGSNGFAHAQLASIPFDTFSSVAMPQGAQLSIKVYGRNACAGSGKNSGTARLWYNDSQANSLFDAKIGGIDNNYYLLTNSILGTNVGAGPKQTSDISSGAKCSPFKSFGTWTITL